MIGVGLSAGLSGSRRARAVQDPLPALDLDWATNRSLPASYGPTPTFTRASTGTYFDGQGILKSAAVNGPRFDHVFNGTSWVSRGLLVEEQRTNIALNSEDLSHSSWIKSNATVSANAGFSPDGSQTADLIYPTTSGDYRVVYKDFPSVNGQAYTISFYAKASGVSWVSLPDAAGANFGARFNVQAGTIGSVAAGLTANIQNCGNGWYRCSVSLTAGAGGSVYWAATLSDSNSGTYVTKNGTDGVLIWGAQVEAGAFPTSYIPTTTTSVVRSADVCQITGTDFSGFWNGTEGSIAVEFDRLATVGLSGYTSPRVLTFRTDDNNNIQAYCATPGGPYGEYAPVIYNGGAFQGMPDSIGSAIAANTSAKIAFCYKANDFAGTLNGAAVVTDNSGTIPAINQLHIGAYSSANLILNGHIARLRYYNARLTNARLQELST